MFCQPNIIKHCLELEFAQTLKLKDDKYELLRRLPFLKAHPKHTHNKSFCLNAFQRIKCMAPFIIQMLLLLFKQKNSMEHTLSKCVRLLRYNVSM